MIFCNQLVEFLGKHSERLKIIAVSEKTIVQPLPHYSQIKAEQERGQVDLPHGPLLNEQKTGNGNIKWPDKRFYKGSIVAGIPLGKGHMIFPDGRRYFGQFSNGTMHGEGEIHWPDGSFYTGEFINNLAAGRGNYTAANGDRFKGTFVDEKPHGYGSLMKNNGDLYIMQSLVYLY